MDAGGSLLLKPTREGAVWRWRRGRSGLGCYVGEGAASAAAAMDAGDSLLLKPTREGAVQRWRRGRSGLGCCARGAASAVAAMDAGGSLLLKPTREEAVRRLRQGRSGLGCCAGEGVASAVAAMDAGGRSPSEAHQGGSCPEVAARPFRSWLLCRRRSGLRCVCDGCRGSLLLKPTREGAVRRWRRGRSGLGCCVGEGGASAAAAMDAGGSLLLKPTREGAVRRWRRGRSGLGCCVGEGAASAAAAMDAGGSLLLKPTREGAVRRWRQGRSGLGCCVGEGAASAAAAMDAGDSLLLKPTREGAVQRWRRGRSGLGCCARGAASAAMDAGGRSPSEAHQGGSCSGVAARPFRTWLLCRRRSGLCCGCDGCRGSLLLKPTRKGAVRRWRRGRSGLGCCVGEGAASAVAAMDAGGRSPSEAHQGGSCPEVAARPFRSWLLCRRRSGLRCGCDGCGGSLLLKPTREGAVRRWRRGRSGLGCCVGGGAASASAAMDAGVVSF
ncbi:hypothetical protein NDU88_008183 [Pleurodeles waltl]|uniref:Uncharacterized protein n=2 Tax=Pleurodeles waltl TaxID=8319 RepID=A0AAV7U4K2_PLEWA|nr:hypothetical protein NDU88_008183 [Pleurodeles waltl]